MTNEELEVYSEQVLDIVSANVKKYREIGLSSGAYLGRAEIRKDKHHFNIMHLAKISKVLGVPIESFFRS